MRSITISIAAVIALASGPLCFGYQLPLVSGHDETLLHDDAPAYRQELLSLHKSLVSIPSISGNEKEVGDFLIDYLNEKGYKTHRQMVAARENTPDGIERFNVLAWQGGDAPDAKVLVSSHIDVVPPHIPYEIDQGEATKGTMIKGRGSVDAKGSVAAMITALEELLAAKEVKGEDVMLLFVVGEEVAGDGMVTFSDSQSEAKNPLRFKAAIFGEPTENKLACGHKGGLFCDVRTKGVGGHSGYPWLGKSANELMIRAFAKVLDTDLGSSKLFGNTTVNIGRFDGGVASNVIPEDAFVGLAVRVAIGPEKEGHKVVQKRIQEIFDEIDEEAFEFTCSHGYGSVKCNCNVDGFEPIVVNYGTDIANLQGDHTRYLYGPGTILVAHGAHENLTVADLETSVEGYKKLILHALEE